MRLDRYEFITLFLCAYVPCLLRMWIFFYKKTKNDSKGKYAHCVIYLNYILCVQYKPA